MRIVLGILFQRMNSFVKKKKKKIRCSNTDFPELWKLVNLNHAAYITF